MLAALAAVLLAQDPGEGKVTPGGDRSSAVHLRLSGGASLHFAARERRLNEAGVALGADAASIDQDTFWSGRVTLRADVELRHEISAVFELENRSFDEGRNIPFSSDPEEDEIAIKKAYVEVPRFADLPLALRLGIQEVSARNRPHDEAFFLRIGESESFWAGFSATHIRNTVDRDVQEATGFRLTWDLAPVASLHAFGVVSEEGGSSKADEQAYGLLANAALSESLSLWLLAAWMAGPEHGQDVWTVAAGTDAYFGAGKQVELFAEGYLQRGHAVQRLRKSAFAFQAGARWVGAPVELVWLEAAYALRSGDEDPADGRDQAFQSYEDENRFLILQSAEFGLDVDTNVRLVRAAAGVGPLSVAGRPLRFQLDVGSFAADDLLRDAAGAPFSASRRRWGLEADVSARWSYSESVSFWAKAARLEGSSLLERLTPGGDDGATLAVAGADVKF